MSNMVYRRGDSKKWKGVGYDFEIVSDEDMKEYVDAGWVAHPDQLLEKRAEPETDKKDRKKPGPKPKAAKDADSN